MRAHMAGAGWCAWRIWTGRAWLRAPRIGILRDARGVRLRVGWRGAAAIASVTAHTPRPSRICARAASPSSAPAAASTSPPSLAIPATAGRAPAAGRWNWRSACESTPGTCSFRDRIQGAFRQDVALASGDLILKRRDGWFAYLLAVVVDDAYQGVTQDRSWRRLARSHAAARSICKSSSGCPRPPMRTCPPWSSPTAASSPKSARSVPLDPQAALRQLLYVFELLGLAPPASLAGAPACRRLELGGGALGPAPARPATRADPRGRPGSGPRYPGNLLQRRRKRSLALTLHCAILRLHSIPMTGPLV